MSEEIENTEVEPSELNSLKAQADLLGIKYHPAIGVDKLRIKVTAALKAEKAVNAEPVPSPEQTVAAGPKKLSPRQIFAQKKKQASELVRIRLTNMNPTKKEWEGEIISVGSPRLGTFKKFIPFHAEEGWHVPRIIYNVLRDKKCQIFVTKKNPDGSKSRVGKLINEFAIEVLPPLTPTELADLAKKQAMAGNIG